MDEQDDTRLDNFLRDKLGAYRPAPADAVWNAIESRLGAPTAPPPARRAWGGRVLPALVAGLIGVLLGWLLPRGGTEPGAKDLSTTTTTSVAAPGAGQVSADAPAAPTGRQELAAARSGATLAPGRISPFTGVPATGRGARVRNQRALASQYRSRPRASGAALPSHTSILALAGAPSSTGSTAIPAILWPLASAEAAVQAAPADSAAAARTQRQQALYAEKRALAHLQRRADSLLHLLSLGAEATALAPLPAELTTEDTTPPPPREVVVRREPRLAHRWLLALTATPERSFLTTTAPATDGPATLRRHHETGRTGLSAAGQAEYRLSERVSVGAGAGYAQLNTELRLTEQRTTVDVRYETITTVNGSQTTTVTTPILAQRSTETYRVVRPTYHFLTVPVLARYRLTPATRRTRCWADVAVGAQAQLFLGGTQPVSLDGQTFQLQRVGAGEGMFRPATLAFTGALAVNYALTPRLAASAAPAVRWQTQSIYRSGAGVQQRPTSIGLQLGLHWTL